MPKATSPTFAMHNAMMSAQRGEAPAKKQKGQVKIEPHD